LVGHRRDSVHAGPGTGAPPPVPVILVPGWRRRAQAGLCNARETAMARNNVLYMIIGALIVAVGVLGYSLYQSKKEPTGVEIKVGPGGLSIE
jgi:hypothetical protein